MEYQRVAPHSLSIDEKDPLSHDVFNFTQTENADEKFNAFTGNKSCNKTVHDDSSINFTTEKLTLKKI